MREWLASDVDRQPLPARTPLVSRPDDPCETDADRTADRAAGTVDRTADPADAGPVAAQSIPRQEQTAHPLDPTTREHFERRLGYNFASVRVHRDHAADESARELGALAFTNGRDIVFRAGHYEPHTERGRRLLGHELAHVVQQDSGRNRSGPAIRRTPAPAPGAQPNPGPTPGEMAEKLIKDFAGKFPDAAKLIKGKKSAEQLVQEAAVKGVKFGGFAEDGPGKDAWAYTIGDTVYVPKARTDAIVAMSDFLFELNNAIRKPKFDKNTENAAAKKITPKQFARRKVELEVEGMLRMGSIWFDIKGGDKKLDKYDNDFFLAEYQAYKDKKKTKSQIVDEVLQWRNGSDHSKTNEQYYMDQYPK